MEHKRKPRPIPPIRRYRRAALCEIALIVILSVLLAVIIVRMRTPPALEIREDRLMTPTQPVHVITMEPKPTPEITSAPTSTPWVRYPVPLADDLQRYICEQCREKKVPSSLVIGVIHVETEGTFDPNAVGDYGEIGLMQIDPYWHGDRMDKLGVFDLYDAFQNVSVGIDLLDELTSWEGEDRPIEWVLMAYNGGPGYADNHWSDGEVSVYAQRVLNLAEFYDESAMVVTS